MKCDGRTTRTGPNSREPDHLPTIHRSSSALGELDFPADAAPGPGDNSPRMRFKLVESASTVRAVFPCMACGRGEWGLAPGPFSPRFSDRDGMRPGACPHCP